MKEAVDTPTGQADDVQEPDGDCTVFDGDVPRRAVSRDGYELVFHMPRAFRGQTLVRSLIVYSGLGCDFPVKLTTTQTNLHDDILEWSRAVPLNTKGKNDRPECYVQEYDTKGTSKLALLWHAVGHKVRVSVRLMRRTQPHPRTEGPGGGGRRHPQDRRQL